MKFYNNISIYSILLYNSNMMFSKWRFKLGIIDKYSAPMTVDLISELRKAVIDRIYLLLVIFGGIAFGFGSIDPISNGNWLLFASYIALYLLIIFAYLAKNLSVNLRSYVLLFCLTIFGISELWYFGFGSLGYLFLYAGITIACWLVSIKWGIILLLVSSIITFVIALFYSYGNLDMIIPQRQIASNLIDWLSPFFGFFVISTASISFIGILFKGLQKNMHANIKYQEELQSSNAKLKKTVSLLDTAIESFPGVYYLYENPPEYLLKYNENIWKMTGYTESEIKTMTNYDWYKSDTARSKLKQALSTINNKNSISVELPVTFKDGKEYPWLLTAKSFSHEGKKYYTGFGLDLTKQKELESKFKLVFEKSKAGIIITSRNGDIIDVNDNIIQRVEMNQDKLIGFNIFNFSPESDKLRRKQLNEDLFDGIIDEIHEERGIIMPDGTQQFADVNVGLINYSTTGSLAVYVIIDVTEKRNYQDQLEISLNEKGILLQEVHHRVRNNLQIISSLINISSSVSDNIEDFKQRLALRIQAMTLMHERLSEEEGFASLDIENYVHDLIGNIYELYEIDINKIKISLNIPEQIIFTIDVAASIGLLLNEIISNAILHAFKGLDGGKIVVEVHKIEDYMIINIKDNGIGLPSNYKDKNSFGYLMIESLINKLKGKIISNIGFLADNKGSEFILKIPE